MKADFNAVYKKYNLNKKNGEWIQESRCTVIEIIDF